MPNVANFVYDQDMKAQAMAVLSILSKMNPSQVGGSD